MSGQQKSVLVSLVFWTTPINDYFAFSYLNAFEN